MTHEFDSWFALYLDQDEAQVRELLCDKTAIRFLIAWSLFETSCFGKFARLCDMTSFAHRKAGDNQLCADELDEHFKFFHNRYQDPKKYSNLMHGAKCEDMNTLIKKPAFLLNLEEKILFTAIVVFRYRNNIFHGNKRVASWLSYRDCILRCIAIVQAFMPVPIKVDE